MLAISFHCLELASWLCGQTKLASITHMANQLARRGIMVRSDIAPNKLKWNWCRSLCTPVRRCRLCFGGNELVVKWFCVVYWPATQTDGLKMVDHLSQAGCSNYNDFNLLLWRMLNGLLYILINKTSYKQKGASQEWRLSFDSQSKQDAKNFYLRSLPLSDFFFSPGVTQH